jgi:hypothetical protein
MGRFFNENLLNKNFRFRKVLVNPGGVKAPLAPNPEESVPEPPKLQILSVEEAKRRVAAEKQ